jgi:hypothetical protein
VTTYAYGSHSPPWACYYGSSPIRCGFQVKTWSGSLRRTMAGSALRFLPGNDIFKAIGRFLPLAVLKPNRIIRKRMDANCSSFHLRVFLGLLNPRGQRQTSTLTIPHDNFGERKAKFNLEMSRTTQMHLYKCIHVP